MVAKWKKEKIGLYKKNVTAQFRAVRYLKKSYEVNPTADAKKALDEAIPKRNANRCWAGGGMFLGVLGLEAKRRRR